MKSKADLDQFFDSHIKAPLLHLEERRLNAIASHSFRGYKTTLKWLGIICVVALIAGAVFNDLVPIQVVLCIPATALYAIVTPIVIYVRRSRATTPIQQELKQLTLTAATELLAPSFSYVKSEGISKKDFNSSGMT